MAVFIFPTTCCHYYLNRCKEPAVQIFYPLLEDGNILMFFLIAFTSRIDLVFILLSYISLQMGFFKRSDPYGTTMEKAQLKPQASSEA